MVRERGQDIKLVMQDHLTKEGDSPVAQLLHAILAAVSELLEMEATESSSSSSSSTGNNSTDNNSSGISALVTAPTLLSEMPVQFFVFKPRPENEIWNMLQLGYKGPYEYREGSPVAGEMFDRPFNQPCVC
jgi:hypothetical protein